VKNEDMARYLGLSVGHFKLKLEASASAKPRSTNSSATVPKPKTPACNESSTALGNELVSSSIPDHQPIPLPLRKRVYLADSVEDRLSSVSGENGESIATVSFSSDVQRIKLDGSTKTESDMERISSDSVEVSYRGGTECLDEVLTTTSTETAPNDAATSDSYFTDNVKPSMTRIYLLESAVTVGLVPGATLDIQTNASSHKLSTDTCKSQINEHWVKSDETQTFFVSDHNINSVQTNGLTSANSDTDCFDRKYQLDYLVRSNDGPHSGANVTGFKVHSSLESIPETLMLTNESIDINVHGANVPINMEHDDDVNHEAFDDDDSIMRVSESMLLTEDVVGTYAPECNVMSEEGGCGEGGGYQPMGTDELMIVRNLDGTIQIHGAAGQSIPLDAVQALFAAEDREDGRSYYETT